MNKKLSFISTLLLCFFFFSFVGTVHAQTEPRFQLRNGDFEAPFVPAPGASATGTEPPYWHSFGSLTGSQAGLARSGAQISRSTDTRNGMGFSCKINARSVFLVATANGNMTTGRVNAGSMSAADPANHNFTDPEDDDFNEPWTSTPDSIRFWAKYMPNSASQYARMSAYIHDDFKFTDPLGGNANSANHIVAFAEYEWQRGDQGWHQYTIPFDYASYAHLGKTPKYILITFTTNRTPGSGSSSDALFIDDIEMVYSALLVDLKVNGVTIDGFTKNLFTYGGPVLTGTPGELEFPYQPSDFSWTPEVDDISDVIITNVQGPGGDADGGHTSILVIAEDGVTTREYKILYFSNYSDDNNIAELSYTLDGETPIPVPGFTPSQQIYPIILTNPEEVRIPQIRAEDVILSDIAAEIQRIEQPTHVNSTGTVVVKAENYKLKTYNLIFSKEVSSNSKLSSIKINNVEIQGFDPDILEYNYSITNCATTIPTVTNEKASAWANVTYIPATFANRTATITVTAEDGSQTIYTVNFIFSNDDVSFTRFRFSAGNSYDITPIAGQTVYERSISFTAAQTITPTLTCSSATIERVPASTVYYPDTNYFNVTALDGITKITYKIVLKNTNCFVATGNNNGFRYNYNGLTNQSTAINISSSNNNNLNPVTTSVVATPVGPNVPAELVVYGLAAAAAASPPTYEIQQPSHRNDTAIVTLTANDGVTQKIYRVPFRPNLSTDATLSDIKYNGNSIIGFAPSIPHYTAFLIFATTPQVPEIIGVPNFQWLSDENIVVTPAATLSDTTFIKVTAENGSATRTYSVDFEVVEPDGNAYLHALYYDNKVIAGFNPTTFNYTVDIPYSTQTPPVLLGIPMVEEAHVFHEQPNNPPPFKGEVLVMSRNMEATNIYTVHFNMVKNTNAALADIQINGISLEDFEPEEFTYDVELSYTEWEAPIVTTTPAYEFAQVVITQIDTVEGTVTIYVTAEDENYTAVYTINFTRELSPVNTIEIIGYDYNNQTYTYILDEDETEITIMLPVETEGIPTITHIVLTDNRANDEIEEQPDESNDLTGTIVVTAEDLTEKIYTVVFEKTLSESTLLTGIFVNGTLVAGFDPDIETYYLLLPYNTTQIQSVTATAAWIHTDVQVTQATTPFGQATVTITSEDGQNIKIYTVVFQRQGNPHLTALSYRLAETSIPVSGFDPATLTYNIPLPMATAAVPVLEYILTDDRCSVYHIQQDAPNGTSQLKIVTWNQDDSLTYTVNFTVIISTEPTLEDLQVNGVTVPNFDTDRLDYAIEYEYGTEDLPVVTAQATYPDAEVIIEPIEAYPDIVSIKVIAGDTAITRTYTIAFSVEPGNNTSLFEITINGAPLQAFDENVYFYEINLPYGMTVLPTVGATAEDDRSIVEMIQAEQLGDTAKIFVTALNGDVALYQILFVMKNDNARAKNIFIDWKPLENFNGYLSNYDYTLPANYVGYPLVLVEPEDANATPATTEWTTTLPLQASITITAEDEKTQFTYRITFYKESGIVSYDNETEIYVFPNPSSDKIHFVIDEKYETSSMEIYSVENKKIGNYKLQGGNNEVNIEHLSKGIYFYKIFTDTTMLGVGKFVKN